MIIEENENDWKENILINMKYYYGISNENISEENKWPSAKIMSNTIYNVSASSYCGGWLQWLLQYLKLSIVANDYDWKRMYPCDIL